MRYHLVIVFLLTHFISSAQNNIQKFRSFSNREGLSNNNVSCIIRDNHGFLWIGTTEGLNRFDGNHFISFFTDPDHPNSLSGNNIYDILEYRPGQLLIATNNGLSVLNSFSRKFENEKVSIAALRRGSDNIVRSLFQDQQKRVYINYAGKIDVFDNKLNYLFTLTDLGWAAALKGILVNKEHWMQDSEGQIWIPSDNLGICIVNEKAHQVFDWQNNPQHYPFLAIFPVRSFYYDEAEKIVWYGPFGDGLKKYDLEKKKLETQTL